MTADLSGASGAQSLTSAQRLGLVDVNGSFVWQFSFVPSADLQTQVSGTFYLLTADATGTGDIAVSFDSTNGWAFKVNGSTAETAALWSNCTNIWLAGDNVTALVWYSALTGKCGVRFTNNGCVHSDITAQLGSHPAIPQPSNLWLFSNRGSSSVNSVQFSTFQMYPAQFMVWPASPAITIIGDSITSALVFSGSWMRACGAGILMPSEYANNRVRTLAYPGGTVATQDTFWKGDIRARGDSRVVILDIGINDLGASTPSQLLAALTAEVADVHSVGAHAVIVALDPCAGFSVQRWTDAATVNAALNTVGADVVVSGHVAQLDRNPSSPTGYLADAYLVAITPDGLHSNQAAKNLKWGGYVRPALLSAGYIH
jgi:hypothetical protein